MFTGLCSQASMKIGDSKWSDKFSLDTVGSMGTINCKAEDLTYQVGSRFLLSYFLEDRYSAMKVVFQVLSRDLIAS